MLSYYAAILLLLALEAQLICGQFFRKDYVYINEVSSFYKIHTMAKTWSQAKVKCLMEGGSFFYPETEAEALAVTTLLKETQPDISQIFIGVANWNVNDIYETVDGKRIEDVCAIWAHGEPNNNDGNEACLAMQRDGSLKDVNCEFKYPFICKKPLSTLVWNKECNTPYSGYKYNKDLNRCYKFHLAPKNWTDAYVACDAEQSYLAIVNSPEEDQYLVNVTEEAPKDKIGGHYLRGAVHLGFHNKNGIWETIKGIPLEDSGFGGGWGNTQPDGRGTENCGSMFYTGELNDIGCWRRMFFICEHEIESGSDEDKPKCVKKVDAYNS